MLTEAEFIEVYTVKGMAEVEKGAEEIASPAFLIQKWGVVFVQDKS